ncbi:hypothetical protein D3C87_2062670 [compost metagenome]
MPVMEPAKHTAMDTEYENHSREVKYPMKVIRISSGTGKPMIPTARNPYMAT